MIEVESTIVINLSGIDGSTEFEVVVEGGGSSDASGRRDGHFT